MVKLFASVVALSLSSAAFASNAAEPDLRLSLGNYPASLDGDRGVRFDLGDGRRLSVGPTVGWRGSPTRLVAPPGGQLALGGYVEYSQESFSFGASVSAGEARHRAELSAGYAATPATSIRVRLGTDWGGDEGESYFSPNPAQFSGGYGAGRDYDLALSLSHAITPNVVLGGMAAASAAERPTEPGQPTDYVFGASIGFRF